MNLPLSGITVLEFSQYLAGPYAGLRLADLGARVIKVERPGSGDACRQLATKNMTADGDSLVFHTINRNKESYTADLKNPDDLATVKELIKHADVMTHNFRPGVMEKIGLDYATVAELNPHIVYGEVTGYGKTGPWSTRPGQDLLAQTVSGLTWLTGGADDAPIPFGMAVGDMICGTHLAQGLLAGLLQRARTGLGARVEVSLLESLLDLQFEVLTEWLNNNKPPQRSKSSAHAHAYLPAPYGVFTTSDGHIALAMGSLTELASLVSLAELNSLASAQTPDRHAINKLLANHLATQTSDYWLSRLEAADFWCAEINDYKTLTTHSAFEAAEMQQTVKRPNGCEITTLCCPIRINGQRLTSTTAAPSLANTNERLELELNNPNSDLRRSAFNNSVSSTEDKELPLHGITVLDFSQFLSGPSASLRLADLGAKVIKIEQPVTGDICRTLYAANSDSNKEPSFFQAINRNKDSICVDLKDAQQRTKLHSLIATADVIMHNFRPGVAERLKIDRASLAPINPRLIYGEISGYGYTGPWRDKPGQDLLLQALSGMAWLSGNREHGPLPMGLPVVDIFSGAQLAQGLIAQLIQKQRTGECGSTEVAMLDTALDFQFEPLTLYFQDGGQEPERTQTNGAHAYLGAPYGIYETLDGYIALAMANVLQLGELLECEPLLQYSSPKSWFNQRDEIKQHLAKHLRSKSSDDWLAILVPADIWCADVHNWEQLRTTSAYQLLDFEQEVVLSNNSRFKTTRCPIRFDGKLLRCDKGAPELGEHTHHYLVKS